MTRRGTVVDGVVPSIMRLNTLKRVVGAIDYTGFNERELRKATRAYLSAIRNRTSLEELDRLGIAWVKCRKRPDSDTDENRSSTPYTYHREDLDEFVQRDRARTEGAA